MSTCAQLARAGYAGSMSSGPIKIRTDSHSVNRLIYDAARQTGFDLCGIAPVDLPGKHVHHLEEWLAAGHHGTMEWMKRRERADLRKLAPWVKSVICLGLNYWLPEEKRGVASDMISIYAQGRDYHDVMKRMMEQMLDTLFQKLPAGSVAGFEAKIYIDTGPILERAYAESAGLGWIGKNTCLINEHRGSWLFLGEILTSLELPTEVPPADRCGTCTRCLDACPTGAFDAPYQLDASKCISYQTIELRGSIPEAHRPGLGTHIFGCDICQEVCPWNSRAKPTQVPDFLPLEIFKRGGVATPQRLAQLGPSEFRQEFHGSPLLRPKLQGVLRNAAVAMGNGPHADALAVLENLAKDENEVVASHARWAVERIRSGATQPS